MLLSQRGYVHNILIQFGMESVKPAPTPTVVNIADILFENQAEQLDENRYLYRAPVGSLRYFSTHAKLDISFNVGISSRSVAHPIILH